ncbi:protein ScwA [Aspergillus clavatus NRRL 1]|uniref:Uncharacterized protein n=1 Tax=Aspergillus clavatus (strain ATCC 1007 / CBS 513.65 / DSM 816 / NCTC 3887 / NRRL 1 / QM 1276 / 107) TaxID=344612 RepID=A1CHP0_ASPCL|nr:uncharacterized protein ACLA_048670 [Aspergillus clavatus NRRL 1]EAW10395.1 hypothetical protein ACLA_048670 [Aspergillus clavatus NRRL 1]
MQFSTILSFLAVTSLAMAAPTISRRQLGNGVGVGVNHDNIPIPVTVPVTVPVNVPVEIKDTDIANHALEDTLKNGVNVDDVLNPPVNAGVLSKGVNNANELKVHHS